MTKTSDSLPRELLRRLVVLTHAMGLGRGWHVLQDAARLDRLPVFAADSLAEAGRLTDGITLLEAGLRTALRRRRFLLHDETPPPRFSQTKQDAPNTAPPCLGNAVAQLRKAGARPFLAYGSLLGWVRDGGFVAGDRDVDLGLFDHEISGPTAADCLRAAGFDVTREAPTDWPDVIKALHPAEGLELDLVFFRQTPAGLITRWSQYGEVVQRVRRPFALRSENFLGVDLFVPDPPENFLDQNYGKWREPADYYHFLVSPEIETNFQNPLVRFHARRALRIELQNGRRAGIRTCLQSLLRKDPTDPLWPWVQQELASIDPFFKP